MSIKVFIPFEDPAQHLFDTSKVEVANGVGRLKSIVSPSEVAYWNFDEDGNAISKRGGLEIDLPSHNIANPSSAIVQNGWLEMKGNDFTYGNVLNIPKVDSGNNPSFRTKLRMNSATYSAGELISLTNNENGAQLRCYLQNQGGGVTRIWSQVKDNTGAIVYSGILGTRSFAIDDILEIGFMRDEDTGKYHFTLDGVRGSALTLTILFNTINLNLGGVYSNRTNWSYKDIQLWNGLERPQLDGGVIASESFELPITYQYMITVAPMLMDKFVSFTGNYRYAEAGEVMHQLMLNSQYWWFNVAEDKWEEITSPAQINTPEEITLNVSKLELEGGVGKYVQLVTFMKSNDGYKTPEVLDLEVSYRFYFGLGAGLSTCIVFGSIVDSSGRSVKGAKIRVWGKDFFHGNTYVTRNYEYITNDNGKWDLQIVETETIGKTANVTIEYTDLDGVFVKKDFKNLIIENVSSKSFVQLLIDNGKTL